MIELTEAREIAPGMPEKIDVDDLKPDFRRKEWTARSVNFSVKYKNFQGRVSIYNGRNAASLTFNTDSEGRRGAGGYDYRWTEGGYFQFHKMWGM